MRTALQFNPIQNAQQFTQIQERTGFIEIINESRFQIYIMGLIGGNIKQIGNTSYIYPVPPGGCTLTILAIRETTVGKFVDMGRGPMNQITVNVWEGDELATRNFPMFLPRQMMKGAIQVKSPQTVGGVLTADTQTSYTSSADFPTYQSWIQGFDISVGPVGAASKDIIVTLTNVLRPGAATFHMPSSTTSSTIVQWRPPEDMLVIDNTVDVILDCPAVSGIVSGAVWLTLYAYAQ
jgi:hypothetical protein